MYRARDKRLGREVAVKVLSHELSRDPERVARFEREARSASALNHPGIITIHEFGSESGEAYLVMELVRGESLREIVARGPLPRRQLYAIATGIADALAAAHGAGIVHRDLKPENVMVTPDGGPKILDFGLVKIRDVPDAATQSVTSAHVSHAGSVLGTASYMSPEQARGEAVDFRSDQFSFGLILQEMATGRHPFRRSTQLETLAAILNDDPEPPEATLAEPFIWIIERCLAKAPAERYGSTADLARDLARLRDRSPSGTVRPIHGEQRLSPRTKRMAAAVGIILLSALAFTLSAWRRTPPEMGDPIQLSVATPEIADVHAGEVAAPVVISPDGRYLAIYGADATGTNHLWLHDLRSGTTRVLAERAFAAGWSSDSRAIAYFAEGKLKTVAVDGGPARTVCDARPEGTPVWQGDTILYGQYSMKPGIYRVNAGGGTPEQVIAYEGDDPAKKRSFEWWPADIFEITPGQDRRDVLHRGPGVEEPHDVSRDGKWLLFISYTPPVGADILTLPLEPRGKPSAFATTQFQELFPRFSPDAKWVAYSSDVSGQPDVYVRPFVGSAGPVRISQAGGTRPRWSRDGKELFFLAPGGRLMAVPVGTDFGVPRMLFQAADAVDFDVSVDGTQFLVQLIERSEQPPLNILVNWRAV